MRFKKIIIALLSSAVVFPVSVSAAFAENVYDDTRYNNSSPAQTVEDYLNGVSNGVVEAFNTGIGIIADFYRQAWDPSSITDPAQINSVFQAFLDMGSDGLTNLIYAQRLKDLVDYANGSTTGLTTGKSVLCFTAKRKLITGSQNGDLTYELDTMYYWRDFNHTLSHDFTGVTVGNFFMQPNTIYVTRQFSNGDFDCFYTDATQFDIYYTDSTSGIVNEPFTLRFREGATYYIYNSDGSVESLTFKSGTTSNSHSMLRFQGLDNNLNAISIDNFYRQAQYYPDFGRFVHDGRLTNAQLFFNNAMKDDGSGSMMLPNNYAGSSGWGTWYLSYGSFIGNSNQTLDFINRTFTTNDNNYDPRKPPGTYNIDPNLRTDTLLTTNNVNNYNDYGISYNSSTNQFELDIDALAAGIAGLISPDFNGNFGLVYDAQPGIGLGDWNNLDNNVNADFDTSITDISNTIESLLPSNNGWTPPSYPPVNTSAFIPAQYPTVPTGTIPPSYGGAMASTLNTGWDLFDSLGILAFICPLIFLLLIWKLTGK